MNATLTTPSRALSWLAFDERHARRIDAQLTASGAPCCPGCGDPLAVSPEPRAEPPLPLDAVGYDLECLPCRRFHTVVLHTERSLRLVRMRRLAAAVSAVARAETAAAA
jgi:hypothetical protein